MRFRRVCKVVRMQHPFDQALWRASFIDALRLVGEAAARLPVGASDPILCGEFAVELYTGGLWATDDLELYVVQPRLLTAELFAVGFRWSHSPRYVDEACGIRSSRWG